MCDSVRHPFRFDHQLYCQPSLLGVWFGFWLLGWSSDPTVDSDWSKEPHPMPRKRSDLIGQQQTWKTEREEGGPSAQTRQSSFAGC
jgi:hypothetical protein